MEEKKHKIEELETLAKKVRGEVVRMLTTAQSGHTAGSLSMTDILVALYFALLKYDSQNPDWDDRDRVILSNGHTCPALYAVMAEAGYFPKTDLPTLRKLGSALQGHPHREWLKGIETSSGPLGSGLSQAVGMALVNKIDSRFFYCLMSDGEMEEGQVWEALMLASKKKLANLITFIDRNGIQISGETKDVMPLDPLREKLEAFNWQVLEIDGHNFEQIIEAVLTAKKIVELPKEQHCPTVIIAHTVPGKGYPQFENDYRWHGKVPGQK